MPLTASTSSSLLLSSSSSSVADDDDDNNNNESGIIIIDGGSIRSSSNNDGNDSDNAAAAAASPPLSPLSQSSSQSCEMNGRDFGVIQRLPGNAVCIECGDYNYDDDDDDNVVDVVVSPVSAVSASSASNNLDQPLWGSVSFGILFCQICSGKHRGLGTHISFVRSVTMDRWTLQQTEIMKCGGNARCRDFILPRLRRMKRQQAQQMQQNEEEPPDDDFRLEWDQLTLEEKYDNPIAEWYKRLLKEKADSGTLPTTTTTRDITEMNAPDDMPPDLRRRYAAAIRQQEDRASSSPTARSTVVLKDRIQGFGSSPVDSDDDGNNDDCWNPSRRWQMLVVAIPATLLIAGITWYLTNR